MNFNESAKLAEYVWINGEILSWDEAKIHILTHSLHYAGAVFEGMRSYNGKIFKLEEHTERLLKSAEYMHLDVGYSADEINKATYEILEKNKLENAYIRPLVWRGAESLGAYNPILGTNLLIFPTESNPAFKSGLSLYVTPWCKISADAIPVQAKSSAHYAMLGISQKIAQDKGFDDSLILDQEGGIAECSTTNIFFGRDGLLVTPIADRFLNGITRQTVIEMACNMGLKVREERIRISDLEQYDACFATGTSAEIRGISSINDDKHKLNFTNESLVVKLQNEYAKIVGKA